MRAATFQLGLRTISAVLPYGKRLTDDETGFLWLTIPQSVRDSITDEMWAYACQQRRLDPSPDKELTLDVQLFRYLFRLRDGQPAFDWGLKADLPARMAAADRFHPLTAAPVDSTLTLDSGPTHEIFTLSSNQPIIAPARNA